MYDSSTGIKLTHNLQQGNRYKQTFTGTPAADKGLPRIQHTTRQRQGTYHTAFMVGSLVAQWKAVVQPSSPTTFSLAFRYMEVHVGPHTSDQPCTSLIIFVMVPKCFSK